MKKHSLSLLFSCLLLMAAVALKSWEPGFVTDFQHRTFDLYQSLMPRPYADAPVRIVDIDDASLAKIGQWPWPRNLVAKLVDKLGAAGASAISFDAVFAEADRTSPKQILPLWGKEDLLEQHLPGLRDHDEMLAQALAKAPAVTGFVLTHDGKAAPAIKSGFSFAGEDPTLFVLPFGGAVGTLPALENAAKGNGALNSQPDRDGILRRVPLLMRVGQQLYPSLTLESLRVAQGVNGYAVKTVGANGEDGNTRGITALRVGNIVIPTDVHGGQWLYYSLSQPERYLPAWEVMEGTADTAKISGHIVIVGTSAAGLKDIRATPLNPVIPGVEVFAQSLEQALLGISLSRPDWAQGAEITLMVAAGLLLLAVNNMLNPLWGLLFMLVTLCITTALSWYAFAAQHLLIEPVMPLLAVVMVYCSDTMARYLRTEKERVHIRTAFSQYMSPHMVRELASQPEKLALGGENKMLSVMFCDMRNFTSISENLAPIELTRLMSRFLTPITEIILSQDGTIDKYIGDCVMAFWNAPLDDAKHARHAAQAALQIGTALRGLNSAPDAGVPLRASISINTGECCVGNMGTPQRFNYSALGDEVNLASRLEGQSKYYGVDIILGEGTAAHLEGMALLELDLIRVKGKLNAVRIYTLLGDETVAGSPAFITLAQNHTALLAAYRRAEWDNAAQLLQQCLQAVLAFLPSMQTAYERFAQRIEDFRAHPPAAGWDGVHDVQFK